MKLLTLFNCGNFSECFYSLNPLQILFGAVFGAFLGWLISMLYAREKERQTKNRLFKKFSPITGHFECYYELNGQKTNRLLSKSEIIHVDRAELSIKLTTLINESTGQDFEQGEVQVWTGEITMNSVRNGILVWEYRKPEHLLGRNGFKRIIVDQDLNGISLVGETGYGVEKMKRKENGG